MNAEQGGHMHEWEMTDDETAWMVRLRKASQEWLEEYGDPLAGEPYRTSGNTFLWAAEYAFVSELADYRDVVPLPASVEDEFPPAGGFWLYRLWGSDDRLLYIGVTRNPKERIRAHRAKWADLIESVTWEECDDARDMLDRETAAIAAEFPALNVKHPRVKS